MQPDTRSFLEKATRALHEAELLIREGSTEGACSRAYYAMFDAAKAAILAVGGDANTLSKTHNGLIGAFGELLVRNGEIDRAHGRALNQVYQVRLLADYTCEAPPVGDARRCVESAATFLQAIRVYLAKSDA